MEIVDIPPDSGFLLVLDAPKGTNFGLDFVDWKVTEKFKGIQGIPCGIHFVYTSPANQPGDFSARLGFFLDLKPREVVVRRWDPYLEYLVELSDVEAARFRAGVERGEFKTRMGAYPKDHFDKWLSVSERITAATLDRVAPVKSLMASSALHEENKDKKKEDAMEEDQKEAMETEEEKPGASSTRVDGTSYRAFYTEVPSLRTKGLSAEERTRRAMDRGRLLGLLLEKFPPGQPGVELLLSELQFAYVSFILGQCFDGLEQWKLLVHLLCDTAGEESPPGLMKGFLEVLTKQLKQLPADFFSDTLFEGNFLGPSLRALFSSLQASLPPELEKPARALQATVQEQFELADLPKLPEKGELKALKSAQGETIKMVDGAYVVLDEDGNPLQVVV